MPFDPREAPRAIDKPEPGFFELRLVKGGPYVPARIMCDGGMWSAEIDGEQCGAPDAEPAAAAGVYRIWTAGRRITEPEYSYRLSLKAWAIQNDPRHPAARPTEAIDLRTFDSLF